MTTVIVDSENVAGDETETSESEQKEKGSLQKYATRSNSDVGSRMNSITSEQRPRRKSELLELRMGTKFNQQAETSLPRKLSGPPRKRQSSDIAGLLSKLDKKFNPTEFTDEVHLKPGDPGYGKPKEGTKTAARGRKAHGDISEEIVKLCQVIWDHGQETGLLMN